jgi:hypothetical protein
MAGAYSPGDQNAVSGDPRDNLLPLDAVALQLLSVDRQSVENVDG